MPHVSVPERTIKDFFDSLASDPAAFSDWVSRKEGFIESSGLNANQIAALESGDVLRIFNAIELESGSVEGQMIKIVMRPLPPPPPPPSV